jgi:DNA-binding MarR family transcriptional regulator
MKTIVQAPPRPAPRADVAAFELLTRALVGITLESQEVLGGAVSVPQFRLLLALDGLGTVPSSALASALGMVPSSITRLADRLVAAGLVARGAHEHSRSIVTVEVTTAGHALVSAVLDRRHALLEVVLDAMDPAERTAAAAAAAHFARMAGHAVALSASGPVPL